MPVISGDMPGSVTGFQRLGYLILVLYLFLIYSRIFDVKFSNLHIPGISYRLILVLVLLSRAFIPALRSSIGKSLAFMTVWFILAIPFSVWKRGSIQLLFDAWFPNFVIFLATAGLIINFDQCRRAIHTVGYAFFVLTLIAVFWGTTEGTGRLFLPNGKFSNPNEMAQALLLGMPLWWMMLETTGSIVKKAFSAAVLFLMLIMISKCGSRGAMISFIAVVLVVFLRASIMSKMKLIIGGFVILAILVALMPGRLLRRYTTFSEDQDEGTYVVGDDYDPYLEASAIASVRSRRELLKKSVKYTFQHPLFGVGPGMFVVAEDAEAHANGLKRGSWQGTHNSYTQVSSEVGIPAAVAYICAIVFSLKRTSKLYRRCKDDPRLKTLGSCAVALNYCVIVYAVSVFFDYIAYTSMLSVFAGLSAAVDATSEAEITRLTSGPSTPEPIPYTQFRPRWRKTAGVPQEG